MELFSFEHQKRTQGVPPMFLRITSDVPPIPKIRVMPQEARGFPGRSRKPCRSEREKLFSNNAGLFLSRGGLFGNKGTLFKHKRYAVSWTVIRRIKGIETSYRSEILLRIFKFADGKASKSRRQKAREPSAIFGKGVEGRLGGETSSGNQIEEF